MATLSNNEQIGKYWVKSIIKSNPYTETYRVEDIDSHSYFLKLFVLKNIPTQLLNPQTKVVKEIEYSSKLNHRNVVGFIDRGEFQREDGNFQYYITNYFNGAVLIDYVNRNGCVCENVALKIFREVLNGLTYLHAQNPVLCHNDIDPSNIMLSETIDEAVIIDLGHISERCSGFVHFDTSDLSEFFHANETYSGIFDEQGDIFSICAVLYYMLTGKAPWETEISGDTYKNRLKNLWQFRKENKLDIESINCSPKIKALLSKGLSLKPTGRFQNIQEIYNLLDDITDNSDSTSSSPQSKNKEAESRSNEERNYADVDVEIKRGGGNGFKDIAGMQELKDYLFQRVIYVLQNNDIAQQYRITPPNGLLLYGPPGCGKTFFAEKFAEETGYNFMLIKSSDIVSGIHHATEMKIKNLFALAEKNAPIVMCFDEFDAVVPDRGAHGNEYEAKEVNEMLAQLNNCSKKGIFVIATSNRPDKIDPAVKRTGRIDKMYYVPLPDFEARREMFRMYLDKRPVDSNVELDELASLTDGYIASDIAYIVNDAAMIAAFTKQTISSDILKSVLENTKPSLDAKNIESYKYICNEMNGLARRIIVESL